MPIDQDLDAARLKPLAVAAIDNEILAYRAISPGAIASLILGVLSILSFTSSYFLVFAVLAVLVGWRSDLKIQKLPDILTGRGIAQAGITLGLVFGLTAVTISTVQGFLRSRAAAVFARQIETVLTKGSYADAVWYNQPYEMRKDKTPEALVAEMRKSAPDPRMLDEQTRPIKSLRSAIDGPGGDLHFSKIESTADDGEKVYAGALYEVHPASNQKATAKGDWALLIFQGKRTGGKYEWRIEDVHYPYTPATSFVSPPAKKVDDGHGH